MDKYEPLELIIIQFDHEDILTQSDDKTPDEPIYSEHDKQ